MHRKAFVGVIATAALLTAAVPSDAGTGAVQFKVSKAGFIVGVGGGSGVLKFKGKFYPLRVGGVSAGTIGIAQANLVGRVRNINHPQDIAGVYTAVSAGVAVAGGAKAATLRNEKGVVIDLSGKQAGFELSLNLSGLTVSLE
jgi:hypothetical protein